MQANEWKLRAIYDGTGVIVRHYSNLLICNVHVYRYPMTPAQVAENFERSRFFPGIPGLPVFDVGKHTSVVLDSTGATVKHRCVELQVNGSIKDVV